MIYIEATKDMMCGSIPVVKGCIMPLSHGIPIPEGWEEASEEFYRAMEEAASTRKEILENQEKCKKYDTLKNQCAYCETTGLELGLTEIIDFSKHIHDCKHDLIPKSKLNQLIEKIQSLAESEVLITSVQLTKLLEK